MRLAAIALVVLVLLEGSVSACPRRTRVVYAQPCYTPPAVVALSVMPAPLPPGPVASAKEPNPILEGYLSEWEKRAASTTNFRTEITRTLTDSFNKKEREYTGVVMGMKPNYVVMRLDYTGDKTKADYEALICDGKSVYLYSGKDKTITEVPLPPDFDNLMLDFFLKFDAKTARERFDISLFKLDEHYAYLDIKPKRAADQREFASSRLALHTESRS